MSDPFLFQDVFKRIVEVGWSGAIAVIEMSYGKGVANDDSGHRMYILPNKAKVEGVIDGTFGLVKPITPWPPTEPWGPPPIPPALPNHQFSLAYEIKQTSETGTVEFEIVNIGKYYAGCVGGTVTFYQEPAGLDGSGNVIYSQKVPFYTNWVGGPAPHPHVPPPSHQIDAYCAAVCSNALDGLYQVGWSVLAEVIDSDIISETGTEFTTNAQRFVIVNLSALRGTLLKNEAKWIFGIQSEGVDQYTSVNAVANVWIFRGLNSFHFEKIGDFNAMIIDVPPISSNGADMPGNAEIVTPTQTANFEIDLTTFDITVNVTEST